MYIQYISIQSTFVARLACPMETGKHQQSKLSPLPTASLCCFSSLSNEPLLKSTAERNWSTSSALFTLPFSPDVFIDRACSSCYTIFCFFLSTSTHPIWSQHIFFINWAVSGKRKEAHSTFEYMCDLFYCVLVNSFLPYIMNTSSFRHGIDGSDGIGICEKKSCFQSKTQKQQNTKQTSVHGGRIS